VSDTSQGPGWWLASDGKWYGPDSDLQVASGWSQSPEGVWIAPEGFRDDAAPGWWLSTDGTWYTPGVHPLPPEPSSVPDPRMASNPDGYPVPPSSPSGLDSLSPAATPTQDQPSADSRHRFCPICGEPAPPVGFFCVNCGGDLHGHQAPPHPSASSNPEPVMPPQGSSGPTDWQAKPVSPSPPASLPVYRHPANGPANPGRPVGGGAPKPPNTTPAGGWLAITGGAMILIGTLLPWATVGLGAVSRNGFQLGVNDAVTVDGPVLALLGIITIIIGITRLTGTVMPSWLQRSTIISGLVAGIDVALHWPGIHQYVVNVQDSGVAAAIGYGYWLCALGAVVSVIAGFVLRASD